MRLGLTSAILFDMVLKQLAVFCSENRLRSVELMCWPVDNIDKRKFAGVTHVDVSEVIKNGAGPVEQVLHEAGDLKISGLGYYPNPLAADFIEAAVYIEHIKQVILAAEILGVSVVNTFTGRDQAKSVDDNWPRFLATWRPIIEFAEVHGIKIGIENCPMKFSLDEWPGGKNLATSPDVWRRMFNDIPSASFGLNFDPSHLVLQFINLEKAIREFGGKFVHVHAKDLTVDLDRLDEVGVFADKTTTWHTPKIPGRGQVQWLLFFETLREVGYDGDVTIEVEDPEFKSPEERQQAVILSRDFLEPFFALPEAEVAQV